MCAKTQTAGVITTTSTTTSILITTTIAIKFLIITSITPPTVSIPTALTTLTALTALTTLTTATPPVPVWPSPWGFLLIGPTLTRLAASGSQARGGAYVYLSPHGAPLRAEQQGGHFSSSTGCPT